MPYYRLRQLKLGGAIRPKGVVSGHLVLFQDNLADNEVICELNNVGREEREFLTTNHICRHVVKVSVEAPATQ